MAAAATSTTPQLVDKPGAGSAIWNYFGFKTNKHGEAINTEAALCKRCYKTCPAKGGNTFNLAKQLKDKHPDLLMYPWGKKPHSLLKASNASPLHAPQK